MIDPVWKICLRFPDGGQIELEGTVDAQMSQPSRSREENGQTVYQPSGYAQAFLNIECTGLKSVKSTPGKGLPEEIGRRFREFVAKQFRYSRVEFPTPELAADNAIKRNLVGEAFEREFNFGEPPCADCKGTRTYQPLIGPAEPCRTCAKE